MRRTFWLASLLVSLFSSPLIAEDPDLQFNQVSDRSGIVDIENAGDGSRRLFIVQQAGRVFDSGDSPPAAPVKIGTMTIVWSDCNAALVSYMIDSPALSGQFPIQRVVPNNIPLCEANQ